MARRHHGDCLAFWRQASVELCVTDGCAAISYLAAPGNFLQDSENDHLERGSTVYVNVRKFQLKGNEEHVQVAVKSGLIPILKAAPGFQAHWIISCTDGDLAAVSIFDTEAHSHAATEQALAWINSNIRELVILPPTAMFSGEANQVA
jgi:hypothetical protein